MRGGRGQVGIFSEGGGGSWTLSKRFCDCTAILVFMLLGHLFCLLVGI